MGKADTGKTSEVNGLPIDAGHGKTTQMVKDQSDSVCFITTMYSSHGKGYTCEIKRSGGFFQLVASGDSENQDCKARCIEHLSDMDQGAYVSVSNKFTMDKKGAKTEMVPAWG